MVFIVISPKYQVFSTHHARKKEVFYKRLLFIKKNIPSLLASFPFLTSISTYHHFQLITLHSLCCYMHVTCMFFVYPLLLHACKSL